jgi:hypothetical protein
VDFEIAEYPVFDDERRLQPAYQIMGVGVPKGTRNQEDAYKVLLYLMSYEVQLENHRKGFASMRADADAFRDRYGELTLLAGKAVSKLMVEAERGVRDPIFELSYIDRRLEMIIRTDDIFRDEVVEIAQDHMISDIPRLMNERKLFIEEMRKKF